MGTYYRYVNYTRREFVDLSDLRDGGDKESAALYCGPALVWLLLWPSSRDPYRGRWYPRVEGPEDIRIVTDGAHDFPDMNDEFLNISPGLLQSMRSAVPGMVADYHPRLHDVTLVQRTPHPQHPHSMQVANPASATCSCGWQTGPIAVDDEAERDRVLERVVASHVNGDA